ncbi:hypothetical protein OCA8868_02783 [Octadecabacter ascidiaceicola]|uniref:Uncharacterized protein n=1 Tax=Octadecabacter ascidiaceicola TaxID=1655543 RepID=A0A238KI72_9RHOB|nr:hypothetical protein OCA8868_02783 [Octadecabacter ascidiaceicola]
MRARMALEDSDIENGQILTSQSFPTSKQIDVDYDT